MIILNPSYRRNDYIETHKEFRKHNDNVSTSIKTYLEKHYAKEEFKNEWYNGFEPILEKLMEVFDLK